MEGIENEEKSLESGRIPPIPEVVWYQDGTTFEVFRKIAISVKPKRLVT